MKGVNLSDLFKLHDILKSDDFKNVHGDLGMDTILGNFLDKLAKSKGYALYVHKNITEVKYNFLIKKLQSVKEFRNKHISNSLMYDIATSEIKRIENQLKFIPKEVKEKIKRKS